MLNKINVVFFIRKPLPIYKSIEFIFNWLSTELKDDVNTSIFQFRNYSKGIWRRLQIMIDAKRNQGDINHITGDIHFAAILLPRYKTVLTIHDCGMLAGTTGITHQILKLFWFTLPLKRCTYITVVSNATREELLKYVDYPKERIRVIPTHVSDEFRAVPKKLDVLKPIILQYCTTPNKNAVRVINALTGIPCQLILVGKLTEDLVKALAENKTNYTHYYDISLAELVSLYVKCDLLLFPSTYEGFGMPIVEAQKVGRPVITSNILSMPEVAGDAAHLVNPFDVEDIRKGIIKILQNDAYRNELIKKGLANSQKFNGNHIAAEYLRLYNDVISENSSRFGNDEIVL